MIKDNTIVTSDNDPDLILKTPVLLLLLNQQGLIQAKKTSDKLKHTLQLLAPAAGLAAL